MGKEAEHDDAEGNAGLPGVTQIHKQVAGELKNSPHFPSRQRFLSVTAQKLEKEMTVKTFVAYITIALASVVALEFVGCVHF